MRFKLFVVLLMMMLTMPAAALDSDSEQPATLDADDIEMDFATGLRTYRGNVLFKQGSIHLTCEELTTHFNDDEDLDKAVCVGSPGRFKQRLQDTNKDTVGTATTITMYHLQDLITLQGRAKVVQGGTTFTGRIITYDLTTERASVKGGSQSINSSSAAGEGEGEEASSTSARPSLVIQPKNKKASESELDSDSDSDSDSETETETESEPESAVEQDGDDEQSSDDQ